MLLDASRKQGILPVVCHQAVRVYELVFVCQTHALANQQTILYCKLTWRRACHPELATSSSGPVHRSLRQSPVTSSPAQPRILATGGSPKALGCSSSHTGPVPWQPACSSSQAAGYPRCGSSWSSAGWSSAVPCAAPCRGSASVAEPSASARTYIYVINCSKSTFRFTRVFIF